MTSTAPATVLADVILEAVGAAAHRFLTLERPWEESALEVLGELGRAAGGSRCYLFEVFPEPPTVRAVRRFQWEADDAPSQQDIPEASDFTFDEIGLTRWAEVLGAGEPVHGPTASLPAAERPELEREGIRSIAVVPIFVDQRWWGFIGFDECRTAREWGGAELDALRAAGATFGAAIGRARNRQRLLDHQSLLRERVDALSRVAAELTAGRSLAAKLRTLAENVVAASGGTACSVSLLQRDPLALEIVEVSGLPARYADAHRAVWDAGSRAETEQALHLREPVVIPSLADELARDPRYAPLATLVGGALPGPLLVVPLIARDEPLGIVHVFYAAPTEVSQDELDFLAAMAHQGALAVEHARLLDEAARTTLLEERQRLSRELHDSVSQAVYGIALGARTARALLDSDPARVAEPLDYVLSLAEAGLAEMRALIFELRPESLQREGLVAALEKHAAALRARHQIPVEVDLGEEPDIAIERKEAAYRVGQEALHNIVKHARASHVRVQLAVDGDRLVLEVVDDGAGFDTTAEHPGHLGLHTMAERAAAQGGTLDIVSAPGQGTRLELVLPLA
jgi:signal transduction histidine kinase